jgi:ribonuclease HII
VVAAAVILPENLIIPGLKDSKDLKEEKREELSEIIEKKALDIGIGIVGEAVIDRINILRATYLAMKKALLNLTLNPDYLLVDGSAIPEVKVGQLALKKGDKLSHLIAAASVIAKVKRDGLMRQLDKQYPQYGFARHKGYGTVAHLEALTKYGACRIHRTSFRPVAERICLRPGKS